MLSRQFSQLAENDDKAMVSVTLHRIYHSLKRRLPCKLQERAPCAGAACRPTRPGRTVWTPASSSTRGGRWRRGAGGSASTPSCWSRGAATTSPDPRPTSTSVEGINYQQLGQHSIGISFSVFAVHPAHQKWEP